MQKLTEADVRKIHEYKLAHLSMENRDISKVLGYDDATIGDVLIGRTWKALYTEYWGVKKKELDLSKSVLAKISNAVNRLTLELTEQLSLSSQLRTNLGTRVKITVTEILYAQVEKEVEDLRKLAEERRKTREKLQKELEEIDSEQTRIDSLLTLIKDC